MVFKQLFLCVTDKNLFSLHSHIYISSLVICNNDVNKDGFPVSFTDRYNVCLCVCGQNRPDSHISLSYLIYLYPIRAKQLYAGNYFAIKSLPDEQR